MTGRTNTRGRLLPDGTRCYTGPGCRKHGHLPTATTSVEQPSPTSPASWNLPEPIDSDPAVIQQALTSPLRWEGATPTWAEQFIEQTRNHDRFPQTPELLDIIDTPAGEVGVVWLNDSQMSSEQHILEDGMQVHMLGLYHPARQQYVGYLKMTKVDKASTTRSFGDDELTSLRWAERYAGLFSTIPTPQQWKQATAEEKNTWRRRMWVDVAKTLNWAGTDRDGKTVASYRLSEEHAPSDPAVLKRSLALGMKKFQEKQKVQAEALSVPMVDYAHVDDELKGQGVGSALYLYAARRLAVEGHALRGSMNQSVHAQKVWERFGQRFPHQVKEITVPGARSQSVAVATFDLR